MKNLLAATLVSLFVSPVFCLAQAAGGVASPPSSPSAIDPGIVSTPPARVDPGAVVEPSRRVDPGVVQPPPADAAAATPKGAAKPSRGSAGTAKPAAPARPANPADCKGPPSLCKQNSAK